jgi:hypothetical protein
VEINWEEERQIQGGKTACCLKTALSAPLFMASWRVAGSDATSLGEDRYGDGRSLISILGEGILVNPVYLIPL